MPSAAAYATIFPTPMATTIRVFAFTFVLFFVAGAITGYLQRKNVSEKDFITAVAVGYFRDSPKGKSADDAFDYVCQGQTWYTYYPDNHVIEKEAYLPLRSAEIESPVHSWEISAITTGLGVSEIALLIRLSSPLSLKDRLAALAGSLSGYWLGRWATMRTVPSCDSRQILAILEKPENGSLIGRTMISEEINEMVFLIINGKPAPILSRYNELVAGATKLREAHNVGEAWRLEVQRDTAKHFLWRLEEIKGLSNSMGDEKYSPTSFDLFRAGNALEFIYAEQWICRSVIPGCSGAMYQAQMASQVERMLRGDIRSLSIFLQIAVALTFSVGALVGGFLCYFAWQYLVNIGPKVRKKLQDANLDKLIASG